MAAGFGARSHTGIDHAPFAGAGRTSPSGTTSHEDVLGSTTSNAPRGEGGGRDNPKDSLWWSSGQARPHGVPSLTQLNRGSELRGSVLGSQPGSLPSSPSATTTKNAIDPWGAISSVTRQNEGVTAVTPPKNARSLRGSKISTLSMRTHTPPNLGSPIAGANAITATFGRTPLGSEHGSPHGSLTVSTPDSSTSTAPQGWGGRGLSDNQMKRLGAAAATSDPPRTLSRTSHTPGVAGAERGGHHLGPVDDVLQHPMQIFGERGSRPVLPGRGAPAASLAGGGAQDPGSTLAAPTALRNSRDEAGMSPAAAAAPQAPHSAAQLGPLRRWPPADAVLTHLSVDAFPCSAFLSGYVYHGVQSTLRVGLIKAFTVLRIAPRICLF